MRILLYNFVQPEEPGAGGVGVYLRNLVGALAPDHQVITLSSGDRYSPFKRAPRLEFSRDSHDRAVIVNSPVIAPAAYMFGAPEIYLDSPDLDFVPAILAERYGTIDVFHFQNFEGLTRSFFYRLRETFPQARIVYSIHNYHQMCSRVSLWYQDRMVCTDYQEGAACTNCRVPVFDLNYIRAKRRLEAAGKMFPLAASVASPALQLAKRARRVVIGLRRARSLPATMAADAAAEAGAPMQPDEVESTANLTTPAAARAYADFRQANIALVRDVFDRTLAVSARTRQVVIDRGMPTGRVSISYIGTAHKKSYLTSHKIADVGDGLHLGFIGYMQRDKGFTFLLDCLEQMPDALAATVRVTVAARNIYPARHARLLALTKRFRELRYFDGYTHANLDTVLAGVNLGLIPVLWEDNLPQTAIELVSRGIPILTSDRGGAQEIADDPRFVFRAGDIGDFLDRLHRISGRELSLGEFWAGPKRLFSMQEHLDDLLRFYRPQPAPEPLPVS